MNNAAPPPAKWDDLTVRLTSSAAMVVIGAFGVILGGIWFQMLVVFVTAVMVWELWMMIRPSEPTKGMLMAALVASVGSIESVITRLFITEFVTRSIAGPERTPWVM